MLRLRVARLVDSLGLLADQNDANTVLRWHRTLMSADDDDLGNCDLEELAALRKRCGVPHFDAAGCTEGVEVEVG